MFRNYLKTAIRNIFRQKTLSFINIIGLSAGIACFSMFLLYTVNEFSFDKFHKNAAGIYRGYIKVQDKEGAGYSYGTYHPLPLGPAMKQDIPDVKAFFRFREPWGESFLRLENNEVRREKVSFADPDFFTMLSFRFIYGNPQTALSSPQSLVLTTDKAKQLFGTTNAIGRTVELKFDDRFQPFVVSGVTENIPSNSSLGYDLIGSFKFLETTSYGMEGQNNWRLSSLQTFVQLMPGSGTPGNTRLFTGFRKKYYPDEAKELDKWGVKWDKSRDYATYGLQPLAGIHVDTKFGGATVENIDPKNIWILLGIAAIVLLIACINFTTLAVGRLAGRAKEVGVRKVIGGERKQLILQFLCEAVLLAFISAALGLLIAVVLLPYFNSLSGRELHFSFSAYPQVAWMLAGVTLLAGLLAGSYPALVLSGFKPVEVLKSKFRINGSNLFTKTLVTVQFALSIALIISTLVILKQVKYMGRRNPGFNKENVVMIDATDVDTKKIYPLFRQTLQGDVNIDGLAGAELGLGEGEGWSQAGFEYNGKHRQVYEFYIDSGYVEVLGMRLIAGRNLDPGIASDSVNSVIINETMMNEFGWTRNDVIGQRLTGYYDDSAYSYKTPVVVGVIRDFNFRPMKEKVAPQLFHSFNGYTVTKIFARTKPGRTAEAMAVLEKTWKRLVPDYPFKYAFVDESLDRFYKAEKRWQGIAGWAGGISVFLACLGLFGLAMLAAVNRTKEIGIRKVLGASPAGIVGLLSRDFVKLVLIALVIASPVAWYLMNKWLQAYAYRINIGFTIFLFAGGFALAIAFLTVGFHALKAAIANPVKSLRTE
ncbi:MAG: ABC transporter permease [Chitinophagaceae bacterium]